MKKQPAPKVQLPPITLDERLDAYADKVLFPAKLARANEALAQIGVPPRESAPAAKTKKPTRPVKQGSPRPKKAA